MELRRYLSVLRSRLWLLLLTPLLAAGVGYTVADTDDLYRARAIIYVGSPAISFDPLEGELMETRLAALDRIALTYATMIDTDQFADSTLDSVDVDRTSEEVVERTETTLEPATQLVYIDVTDPDASIARALANGHADNLIDTILEFEPAGEGVVPQVPAYVFGRAELPESPLPRSPVQSTVLGALFGLIAAVGIAFLLDYLDLSIRTAGDAERRLELPVLGVIPSAGDRVPLGEWAAVHPGRARTGD